MTQKERVREYIKNFGSITGAEAFIDLGIMHLPRRIKDLEEDGIRIKRETASAKNRYGEKTHFTRYSMEG